MNPTQQNQDPFDKNNKPESVAPDNQIVDIAPDVIRQKSSQEASNRPVVPGFQNTGAGIAPVQSINSANFTSNSSGWGLSSNGDAQLNGNHVVTTHFTPVVSMLGTTIYISDGTSPNGTLNGSTGDIALKCDSGKLYVCVGSTTWFAPS